MDNDNNFENQIPDSGDDLSLESILADFKAEERAVGGAKKSAASEHTHAIVMEALGETVRGAGVADPMGFSGAAFFADKPAPETKKQQEPEVFTVYESEIRDIPDSAAPETAEEMGFRLFGKETPEAAALGKSVSDTAETGDIPEGGLPLTDDSVWTEDTEKAENGRRYAKADDYTGAAEGYDDSPEGRDTEPRQGIFSLLAGIIAASAERRHERSLRVKAKLEAEARKLPPEMAPDKAARLYLDQAQAMRLRCIFAVLLSVLLVYLSYGWPALGLLGSSQKIRTLVCMILLLAEMLLGLDIFTNGIVSLFRGKPSSESLIAVSCLVSAADAMYMALSGSYNLGLPFCGVSALSMAFALLGYYLNCKSLALSFRTAALPKSPSVVISIDGLDESGPVLSKAKRPVTGFVRKSEEADIFETSYSLFSPLLILFSLILSLFCTFAGAKGGSFLHTFSACLAVSASLSAVFGFSFPYYTLTKRLVRSGVAIAGYSGCSDLGRIHNVVITDTDIFPTRTLSIANIHISEGFYPDKVISYTSSMLSASGIGISAAFTELMKKNGYAMRPVEEFACHEGGGLVARVSGDMVYVGSSSFMHLMGIKPPKGSGSNSAVYTAVNDELAGIFEVNYTPVSSVQRGLVTLLRGRTEPVFAVRDFNITPVLVKQKFRLPKDSYDFPSFADRYAISAPEAEEEGSVAAMFSKGGLNSVAGLIKRGRALFNALRICAVLSVLGAIVGMLIMLMMLWTGAYDSASCANAMTFMLLWLVPVFVVSLGLRQ